MASDEPAAAKDGEVHKPAWENCSTWLSYGLTFPEACAKHVSNDFKSSRVYIIASGSLSRNTDHVKKLQEALGEKVVGTRHGMQPHSLWSEILEVTEDARNARADLLITLGAGSLTDAAKIVALALSNSATTFSDLEQIHSTSPNQSSIKAPTIPVICIPTSLSGGEYNRNAGGSNDETHRKYSFNSCHAPRLVILDPELTTTTPDRWWLSTGVRAVDHCVECFCSLKGNAESDGFAKKGLGMLVPGLLRCKKDARDLEARLACQKGVVEALKALNAGGGVPMGGSHAIGHQLGPMGVGHGETSCILLPAVCKYNRSVNAERQGLVETVLWADEEVAAVLRDAGLARDAKLGDLLDAIFRALGMPRTLKEFEIGEDQFDVLAEHSLQDRWSPTNPIPITEKGQVLEILEMVKG